MWKKMGVWALLLLIYAVISAGAGWVAGLFVTLIVYEYRFSDAARERRALRDVEKRIVKLNLKG